MMKPDATQIRVKSLDDRLIKQKKTGKPISLYYMNEQQEKPKTYTEKEVKKLLAQQIEACAEAIDADNLSVYNARQKVKKVKKVV